MSSGTRASTLTFCLIVMGLSAVTSDENLPDDCGPKKFGSDCIFNCYCRDLKCNRNPTNGECDTGYSCEPGMFGLACQYVDLFYNNILNTSNPKFTDQDDNSCNDKQSTEAVLTMKKEFPLYWIRLKVNVPYDDSHAYLKDLVVELNEKQVECIVTLIRVDQYKYDVFCSQVHFVTKLKLKGGLVKSLCSVRFSGGRSIAMTGKATQSSSKAGYSAENAIDNDWDGDLPPYENCISTTTANEPGDLSPVWNVTFAQPIVVFYMVFHSSGKQQNTYTIVQWDAYGDKINLFNISTLDSLTFGPQLAQNIRFTKTVSVYGWSSPLTFCELEIWGDIYCEATKTWGLTCDSSKCSCATNDTYCLPNGACLQACPNGTYGMGCDLTCPSQCQDPACHHLTGSCITCQPGFRGEHCNLMCDSHHFGAGCQQTCSTNCRGQTCDRFLGNCTCIGVFTGTTCNDCPHSFYGPQCILKCSTFCVNQECNLNTGKCFKCPEGFTGFNCSVCPPFKYGENCSSVCAETCYLNKCNSLNGTCHSCSPGFTGDYCQMKFDDMQTGQEGLYMLAIAFGIAVLVAIVFSIFLCKRRHLKKDINSVPAEELH